MKIFKVPIARALSKKQWMLTGGSAKISICCIWLKCCELRALSHFGWNVAIYAFSQAQNVCCQAPQTILHPWISNTMMNQWCITEGDLPKVVWWCTTDGDAPQVVMHRSCWCANPSNAPIFLMRRSWWCPDPGDASILLMRWSWEFKIRNSLTEISQNVDLLVIFHFCPSGTNGRIDSRAKKNKWSI